MNRKWKQELKEIYAVAEPEKKKEFLSSLSYPRISKKDFFKVQLTYIRKRYWIISMMFFIILLAYTYVFDIGISAIELFSAMLPLLPLLGIAEIQRSMTFRMEELEMSCRNNLAEIMLCRFFMIASYNAVILLLLMFALADMTDYGIFRNIVYITTPFLLSTGLSLIVSNRINRKNILQICGAVSCSISIMMGNLYNFSKVLYSPAMTLVWMVLFALLIVVLFMEMKKIMKQTEELQWNLI